MSRSFNISIVTPDNILCETSVVSLTVPAELGYLGVLRDHAPLIANLTRGKITLRTGSGENRVIYSEGEGFLEVLNNDVTILLYPSTPA